jgi:hypothetical protein
MVAHDAPDATVSFKLEIIIDMDKVCGWKLSSTGGKNLPW